MTNRLFGNTGYLPPLPEPRNALLDYAYRSRPAPYNAMMDYRPKSEWVSGHYRRIPLGLFGCRYEWVPGYWRREG